MQCTFSNHYLCFNVFKLIKILKYMKKKGYTQVSDVTPLSSQELQKIYYSGGYRSRLTKRTLAYFRNALCSLPYIDKKNFDETNIVYLSPYCALAVFVKKFTVSFKF